MVLRLSSEEADIMRKALVEQIRWLRQQAHGHVAPYSSIGITLCLQRAAAEELLQRLDHPIRELTLVSSRPDNDKPARLAA